MIDSYVQTEVSSGRVAGPFSAPPFPPLYISRFGVIPKNNQPGKWRLILDLSSPVGHSMNDGIPKPPFTVQYASVDAVIEGIMARGRGTLSLMWPVHTGSPEYGYPSPRSPLAWDAVAWEVLCRSGSPVWVAFSAIYFHFYCGP